jgi:hypothetical protein
MQEHVMHFVFQGIALVAVWFVCCVINLTWWKRNPNVIARESRPVLLILAPLATFFVVFGLVGGWLYNRMLLLMDIPKSSF